MKFFHLSDLHIGKQLHLYNLREDQEYILDQIVEHGERIRPDAILLAGDIYDKSAPSAEAVGIFNRFLTKLSGVKPAIPILIISGNHDSAERLEFASSILDRQHIYISGMPPEDRGMFLRKVSLKDEYGEVIFHLLPYVKPGYVRGLFDEELHSYDDAIRKLLERESIDFSKRNVLLSHQFYTAGGVTPGRSDSESITVGGLDNVDVSAVEMFDYVALGHIHRRQKMGGNHIRYCGSPLKYSVSESDNDKALTVITLKEKGVEFNFEEIPLVPLRDVRKLRGLFKEVLPGAAGKNSDDYVSVTITDEIDPIHPRERLEEKFPHLLELTVDNVRTRNKLNNDILPVDISDPVILFQQFFQEMQGRPMNEEEEEILQKVVVGAREAIIHEAD